MSGVLITGASELWTCECEAPLRGRALGSLSPSPHDSVAIVDGLVAEVGPEKDLVGKYPTLERVSARRRLVTPGLIDSHTHLVFAGDRSDEFARRCAGETYQQIAESGGGIAKTVAATRAASVDELAASARDRLAEMMRHGTTTVEVKTGYGLDLASELKMLDAIGRAGRGLVPTFMGGHLPVPGVLRERYVQDLCENMIPAAAAHPIRPAFNDVFCDEGAFSVDESRAILEAGIAHGLRPKIHAEEFAWTGATRLAVELGAVSADHLLGINDGDIEALAASNTVATLLPGTAFYLDLPDRPPVRRMIEAGCILALASDFNPGSCAILSLPFIMGLSCLRLGLRPNEALGAITVNAAAALDLHRSLGQLRPGFVGDVVVWDVPSLEALVGRFVHATASVVVSDRRLLHLSEPE